MNRLALIARITWLVILGLVSIYIAGNTIQVSAQGEEILWTTPLNVSNSGASTEPRIVVDASGNIHIFWLDVVEGVVYARPSDDGWDDPEPINSPFPDSVPYLTTDNDGNIHAFWRNEDDVLLYSRLSSDGEVTDTTAWTTPDQLANSVLTLDVVVGEDGQLFLSYIKNVVLEEDDAPANEDPAGVYFITSDNTGNSWSDPIMLYESLYFRTLAARDAHVQIATASDEVYVVWDDDSKESVWSIRSSNGGQTWFDLMEIDKREPTDALDSASPSRIQVAAIEDIVYFQWQAGHDGSACALYYQWFVDGEPRLESRQRVHDDQQLCSDSNRVFFRDNLLMLLTKSDTDSFLLLAWDEGLWSQPEEQVDLSSMLDPETFRPLTLECIQTALSSGRLYIVGCDTPADGDVWVTSRLVDDLSSLFPPPSIWNDPRLIINGPVFIEDPISVSDEEGNTHVFWSQKNAGGNEDSATLPEESIYYARWDGANWFGPDLVMTSPNGVAKHPAATIDRSGRLLLVWSDGESHELYFSRVNANEADSASAWAAPVSLPILRSAVSVSDILISPTGTINVVYAISLNEARGIYLTKSVDQGLSWSEPITVFDGAAAEWDIVDDPHLTQTSNGNLHLLWTHYESPPSLAPVGLYYAFSVDNGDSWSNPDLVAEGAVVWSEIRGVGERTIHRVWQIWESGSIALWHEYSFDHGLSWGDPIRIIPGFDETVGPAALIVDRFDELHFLEMADNTLRHWLWDENNSWLNEESYVLDNRPNYHVESINAEMVIEQGLIVIFGALVDDEVSGQEQSVLFSANRPFDVPDKTPVPLPTLTATPRPSPTVTSTPSPSPTPTIELFSGGEEEIGPAATSGNGQIAEIALPLIPTSILIAAVILISIRSMRTRQD